MLSLKLYYYGGLYIDGQQQSTRNRKLAVIPKILLILIDNQTAEVPFYKLCKALPKATLEVNRRWNVIFFLGGGAGLAEVSKS